MTQPTMRLRFLVLMAAGFLTACGDRAPATPPATPGTGASVTTPPATNPAEPAPAALTARATPLPVGALAPSFDGLPDGPVVLVFYRGHW